MTRNMPDDAPNQEQGGAATGPGENSPISPLETLQREKDALQDRLLRTAAEFDNYRKRVERDRRDQADSVMVDAIQDLLPIIDNLELALETPAGADAEGYRKGVELIHQQMMELLRRRGVKAI